jgi:hypothetical protein
MVEYNIMTSLEHVRSVLEEWKYYIHEINQFHNGRSDNYYVEDRIPVLFRQLASFLQENEPILRDWMMGYVQTYRKEILIRWYITHVSEWAMDQIKRFPKKKLHPRVAEEWDRLVGVLPFSTIEKTVKGFHAIRDISHCDVPSIIDIHRGKRCDDCLCCFLCEEEEAEWNNELKQRLKESLSSLLVIRDPPDMEDWTPPYSYRDSTGEYIDRNEYKIYLCERRIKKYKPHQSTREMILELIHETMYHSSWTLPHWNTTNEYELFLLLWNALDIIRASIRIDITHITRIEEKRRQLHSVT